MNLEEFEKKKYPFKISITSLIIAIIVGLVSSIPKLVYEGITPSSFGYTIGTLLGVILIPLFFAILFWFLLEKKRRRKFDFYYCLILASLNNMYKVLLLIVVSWHF